MHVDVCYALAERPPIVYHLCSLGLRTLYGENWSFVAQVQTSVWLLLSSGSYSACQGDVASAARDGCLILDVAPSSNGASGLTTTLIVCQPATALLLALLSARSARLGRQKRYLPLPRGSHPQGGWPC